ncbi:MAG: thiamine-phosphate kinase [Deltaproteobacteria bacterium]|nr:thiamine-phosphate kinase [Deltaproteobacteria bacterium]
MKFSEIGEFGFIDSIKGQCDIPAKGLIKGIGDDCAVLRSQSGRVLLFTADMLVQDIHFVIGKIPFYQLGRKAAAVNLSDIAAMGGRPLVLLTSLAVPVETEVEEIQELYRGMRDICEHHGLTIGGGDTVASPDKLVTNISVIGDARENEVLYRSGTSPGDRVYLTGYVGDSIAGLKILTDEITPPEEMGTYFIKAHNEPVALVETGRSIAASGLASAMIDLSDGLLSDLGHICEESRVGALLFAEKIPLSSELKRLANGVGFNPLDLALSGGEDYQLLFTVPAEHEQGIEELFKEHDLAALYHIGEIVERPGIRMVKADGSIEELQYKGFNHFNRNQRQDYEQGVLDSH